MGERTCGYCGLEEEEGDWGAAPVACGDHEYCEGCALHPCDWCRRGGREPGVCPVCAEVWCLDLGDFVCAVCVREAFDEGAIQYCADHGRCFLKMAPCEGLPDGVDDRPDCEVVRSRLVVLAKLREAWVSL